MGTTAVFGLRKVPFGSGIRAMNVPVHLCVPVPNLNIVFDFLYLCFML